MSACKIYICHRRGDASRHVGKLREKLVRHFGEDAVYYGSHLTLSGDPFPPESVRALIEARVIVILIGPKWASLENLELLHEVRGEPDSVRRALALALTRHGAEDDDGIDHTKPLLLPILLEGAAMPDKASLPKALRALSCFTPVNFTEQDWSTRSELLMRRIESALNPGTAEEDGLFRRLFSPTAWRWPVSRRLTARRVAL